MSETVVNFKNFLSLVSHAYHPYLFERAFWLIFWGGAGSGKSYTAAQKLLLRVMLEKDHRFFALRKVDVTCRNSIYQLLLDCINDYGLSDQFLCTVKPLKITFLPNGNTIQCQGLDDEQKLKSIQKPTGFWLEEATEFTPKDVQQIDLRLRGHLPNYQQIMLSFNPISQRHHLRKRFFTSTQSAEERAAGELVVFQTTYRDCDFIDKKYGERLERIADKAAHMVYALGEWGILENVIYGPVILIDEEPPGLKDKIYGLDFGYANPSACMEYQFSGSTSPPFSDLKVYEREIFYEKSLTTEALIAKMQLENVDKGYPIYCDSADPSSIEAIFQAGFNAKACHKGQGSVEAGIKFVKGLEIYGYPTNVNANQEAETYRRQQDRDGNVLERPLDRDNHAMDARRYALMTHLNYFGQCEAFDAGQLLGSGQQSATSRSISSRRSGISSI
jgi:phage terminase large subunit